MNKSIRELTRTFFAFLFLLFYLALPKVVNAAITLTDSQNNAVTNGGDVPISFTASEGDVVIVFGGHPYRAGASVGPSDPGYTLANSSGSTNPEFGAWYKIMGGTPDTGVVGFGTGNAQDGAAYAVYVLSGVDSSVLDNTSTSVGPTNGGSPDNAAIGVSTSGAWVIALAGTDVNDGNVTEPTNYSNKVGDNANDTNDITVWGATREISSTGSEDPDAWSGFTTNDWYAITMVIKPAAGDTLEGVIYQSDESSPYECATSGNLTVSLSIDGGSTLSGTCVADTGSWSVTGVSGLSSGQTVVAYTNGGSVRGSTVLVSNGTPQSDIPIIQNDVVLRDDVNGTITNSEISAGDTGDSDDLISFSGSDITVDPSYEIHVYTGDTYAPGANVTTGSLHLVGDYTGSTETITLTGTSGTLLDRSGTFTQGTTDVRVASASGTPDLLSAATTFHKLTITTPATVINANQAITINSSDNAALTITTGVLNDSGYGITGPGAGTNRVLTIGSGGALCLGGAATNSSATCNSSATSTTTRTMPSFQTYTFDTSSTVYYLSNAATSISATPTYGNLYLNPTITTGRIYTFDGGVTINGDFTSDPTASSSYVLTVQLGGTTTVGSTKTVTLTGTTSGETNLDTVSGSDYALSAGFLDIAAPGELTANNSNITLTGTSSTPFTRTGIFTQGGSTVIFSQTSADTNLTSGSVTFNNLEIDMSGRIGTLGNTISVNNNLTLTAGTLADGGYQITGNGAGTLFAASGTTLSLGASGTATNFPTSYTNGNINLNSSSTVEYKAGVAQTISQVPTYGNLDLVPTITGNVTYTFGGVTGINGDFTINPTSGSADTLTVNMGGAITLNSTGTITISLAEPVLHYRFWIL